MTIFGSARTLPDDPLYAQAHDLGRGLADAGWMVITGAGPGIMQAGMEGAGADPSIGVQHPAARSSSGANDAHRRRPEARQR